MRRFGVSAEDIEACITSPDAHETEGTGETSYEHAWMDAVGIQWKRRRGKYLEVLYVVENDVHVIITLGPRDELPGGRA